MKRTICLALTVVFLLSLTACDSSASTSPDETVFFYYCTDPLRYDGNSSVISAEARNCTGYVNSLEFLLNLYLAGPVERGFKSPFPEGLYAESITLSSNRVSITLSSITSELKGLDLTLACVCLSKTVQELADVDTVYINYENSNTGKRHTITIGPNSYLLTDETSAAVDTED